MLTKHLSYYLIPQYVPGNFNMIVTAPHGGYLDVPNCPYRDFGCYINKQCYYNSSSTCTRDPARCDIASDRDSYTQEIARMVAQNIANLKGKTPHLVIMKCTRFVCPLPELIIIGNNNVKMKHLSWKWKSKTWIGKVRVIFYFFHFQYFSY